MTKPRIRIKAPSRQMTADVVALDVVTSLDIDADRVLSFAMDRGLQSAVVMGWDRDGEEYFSSNMADGADALWLLERMKKMLLAIVDDIPPRQPVEGGGEVLSFDSKRRP